MSLLAQFGMEGTEIDGNSTKAILAVEYYGSTSLQSDMVANAAAETIPVARRS